MCQFIKMEYAVANALAELYDKEQLSSISFETLQKYGIQVEELLREKNISAVILFSKHYTDELLREYGDLFCVANEKISLKKDVDADILRERIIGYISLDLLLAFIDTKVLSVLTKK